MLSTWQETSKAHHQTKLITGATWRTVCDDEWIKTMKPPGQCMVPSKGLRVLVIFTSSEEDNRMPTATGAQTLVVKLWLEEQSQMFYFKKPC